MTRHLESARPGGAEARALEGKQECGAIREGWQAPPGVVCPLGGSADLHDLGAPPHRQYHAQRKLRLARRRSEAGNFFADVRNGGAICRAFMTQGFVSAPLRPYASQVLGSSCIAPQPLAISCWPSSPTLAWGAMPSPPASRATASSCRPPTSSFERFTEQGSLGYL